MTANLTVYEWVNRPLLGTTATNNPVASIGPVLPGQQIFLGGFSGLFFEGVAANGNLKFITHTDRGPNGEPSNLLVSNPGNERPFALPSFQPELVRFELNRTAREISITQRIGLTRPDGVTKLTGLPNIQAGVQGAAYTDEVGVDLFGNLLPNDPLGADLEGIAVAADGSFWMGDEYRPAVYHFDGNGRLLERFIPAGTPTASGQFGTPALPAVYANRRANRGFEAVALAGNKLYAFIQSAIDNPDNTADTTSRNSRNLRILEFDIALKTVTGEYLYILDDISASGDARTDKIGDAVALGNGKILVVERDDRDTASSNKLIYEIDLKAATNINTPANLTGIPTGKTIEQLTTAELTTARLQPVSKRLVTNAAALGYTGVGKLEGMALVDANTIALLNDNDFGIKPDNLTGNGTVPLNDPATPVRLGIVEFSTPLPVSDASFPNDVASGDTTATSTVLWTRSTVPGNVTFQYSTTANFSAIAGTATARVTDPNLPVKVPIAGLTPGTTYYYRVTNAANSSLTGQFRTSAALGTRAGLRFGVSGDWRGELSPYPAISNADDRNLEFFVLHGDTIYADYPSPAVPTAQATTLAEYRAKHSEVYANRNGLNAWGDLRRTTSVVATIDDHEVTNDFAGGAPASSDPRFANSSFPPGVQPTINNTPLYETGLQAFQDYNPLRDDFYGATGDTRTANERKLYRYNTYGSDAATFVLDARSFRDAELPGVANAADRNQVAAFLARSFDINPTTGQPTPRRTMLGRQQIEDLKRDLLQAQANDVTWKFVMVPEPIQNLGVVGAGDRFEGYAAERTELLKFIDDNKIDNVVFVAADIHGTVVNNLTYQLGLGQRQLSTSAFEITTGSVAFDAPFGPTVVGLASQLGLVTPQQLAFYNAATTNQQKDAFVKQLINSQITQPGLGYDPVGLDANLFGADKIDTQLLQGDYIAVNTYGWTEFAIDPNTQQLRVITYGIDPYNATQAGTAAVNSRTPVVVSEFAVNATTSLENLFKIVLKPNNTKKLTAPENIIRLVSPDTAPDGKNGYAFIRNYAIAPNTYFESKFRFKLDAGTNGGDGFAFVLKEAGINLDGLAGGYLGYQRDLQGTPYKSLAIEFDTHQNLNSDSASGQWGDINDNHIAVLRDGNVTKQLLTATPGFDLNNGTNRYAWLEYDSRTQLLQVFLSETDSKPTTSILSYNIDLAATLGTAADIGFSGATGNRRNAEDIGGWQLAVGKIISGGAANDTLNATAVNDKVFGEAGDDILNAGANGGSILTGGAGADTFRVSRLPDTANTISDFQLGVDRVAIAGISGITSFNNLTLTQQASNVLIQASNTDLAILTGIQVSSLNTSNFVFS